MFPWLKDQWQELLKIYNGNFAPQAILIYGKDGLGKKEIANELAKYYLCFNKSNQGYCDQCPSCQNFTNNTHGDFIVINSPNDSQIGIDEIREMIDAMSLSSKLQHGRVVIIENAELLTLSAANSLLKILEEPSSDLLFILTADSLLKIIPTILSRCVKFKVNDPDFSHASAWMRGKITDKSLDLKHYFLLNNYSPVDTVRFINANQHLLVSRLVGALGEFVQDNSRTVAIIELLQEISDTSPYNKGNADPKTKSKTKKIIFKIVYPWLYYIVLDLYRYKVTNSFKDNYFLKSTTVLAPFNHIPPYKLHEALSQLVELAQANQVVATSYIDLHIINWLNHLISK